MRRLLMLLPAMAFTLSLMAAKPKQTSQPPVTPAPLEEDTLLDSEGDEFGSLDDVEVENVPEWLQPRLIGDTLFISCDREMLPRRLVVVTQNGEALYRLAPFGMMGDTTLLYHHPADSLYRYIWTNARVNPYGLPLDSIKQDVVIDMRGWHSPHPGYITSHYGWRKYRFHHGTDIKVQVGDSLRSAWDGQVRIVGWDPNGYGYYVVIRHTNGLETVYGHLSQPLVDEYDKIKAGDVLGLGGNTGRSTGSHLHFEIRFWGNALNPENLVDFNTGGTLKTGDTYTISAREMKQKSQEMSQVQYHRVKSGDTLSGIAKKYHTKVSTLCKLNKLKETSILQIGQRIRVR